MALEVLGNDNYTSWSASIRDYLLAHNLSDVVETTRERPRPEDDVIEFEAWREKNDAALDAILTSCGTDIHSQIRGISSTRNAWYSLAELYGQPSQQSHTVVDQLGSSSNISVSKQVRPALTGNIQRLGDQQGNSTNNTVRADGKNQDYLKYASFLKAVRNGDLDAIKAFLALHPEASSAKLTFGDQTALHIAVLAGHVHIVKELGATSSGDFQMIQCMIDKNPKLVSIPEKSVGSILVVISMCFDSKELSHYLYLRTPLMDLEPEKGHQGASLISFAIYTLTLDIVVDLIRRRPNLAFAIDKEQRSPLYVLASTPDAFPSGKKFVFWKRWIYSWIHIRPCRATDEIRVNIQNLQEKTNRTSVFKQLSEMKLLHVQSQELLSRICKPISTLNAEARNNGGVYAAIFRAIKEGNFEFVYKILRANPDLLYAIEYPTKRTILCSLSYIVKQKFIASSTSYNRLKLHYLVLTQVTTIYYTWLGYLQCPLQFNISEVQLCKCKENFSGLRSALSFYIYHNALVISFLFIAYIVD
ncbi:hypothetical protein CJ030_MR1G020817 [Morella rubra]|uniref:DUF4219 domain-containing protein n=1 Tax=Morella rubra TaxID=262757 RepID=A0A6A1WK02_9ROSI|nr:hypothetical protein CJ030_MR1G020817 [Morella rubra]